MVIFIKRNKQILLCRNYLRKVYCFVHFYILNFCLNHFTDKSIDFLQLQESKFLYFNFYIFPTYAARDSIYFLLYSEYSDAIPINIISEKCK